jgi:signal transduction histidine kinase
MRGSASAEKNGARELLDRVRCVVLTMRIEAGDCEDPGEIDLQRALHALSDHATGPLKFALTVTGDMSALPRQHAVVLLRLVQEAHTNALRHAGDSATRIVVSITRATGEIEVTVSYDGGGAGRIEFGNGLAGMEGRLREIGGALDARSAPGEGFQITARVPLGAPWYGCALPMIRRLFAAVFGRCWRRMRIPAMTGRRSDGWRARIPGDAGPGVTRYGTVVQIL